MLKLARKTIVPKNILYAFLLAGLAIAVQIQITLFARDDYFGLRVNLADLFLPLIGLGVMGALLLRKTQWPVYSKSILWSIFALIMAFTVALYTGYARNGYIESWALINKYMGLYILLSYFALGGWIIRNTPHLNRSINCFTTAFSGFFVVTLCLTVIVLILQLFTPAALWLSDYPWDGFMANRNAFMVLAVFVVIVLEVMRGENSSKAQTMIRSMFWALLPLFLLYNASRAGWIVFSFVVLAVFIKRPKIFLKKIIPFLLMGAVCAGAFFNIAGSRHTTKQFGFLVNPIFRAEHKLPETDRKRFIALEDGLELYQQSNLILGAGLGTYKKFQTEKRGKFIDIIDFTGLWVLVETGLFGMFTLFAFLIFAIKSLYTCARESPFHRALLWAILCTLVLSVFHELMYTRFIWLLLGMGLAIPQNNTANAA